MQAPNCIWGCKYQVLQIIEFWSQPPSTVGLDTFPIFFTILKSFQDYSIFQLNFEPTIVLIDLLHSEKLKFSFLNMTFLTLTLPPSLLGHQTKYLQFMGTLRITKIALFSTMRPFYSYICIGNLESDHRQS